MESLGDSCHDTNDDRRVLKQRIDAMAMKMIETVGNNAEGERRALPDPDLCKAVPSSRASQIAGKAEATKRFCNDLPETPLTPS